MDERTEQDENRLISERREKLDKLRTAGVAFPNDFRRDAVAGELHAAYDEHTNESLEAEGRVVHVAGRMMSKRVMGKVSFANLQDRTGQIQLFIERDRITPEVYQEFKGWDLGDIVGASGVLFKTKTGELSVRLENLRLLVKSLISVARLTASIEAPAPPMVPTTDIIGPRSALLSEDAAILSSVPASVSASSGLVRYSLMPARMAVSTY